MSALSVLLPGFEGPQLPDWVEQRLRQGLAGVCLFGSNVRSPEQLRELTDAVHAANRHAIVAIDEEGGDVSRLYQAQGSPFPGNAVLGRLDDLVLTQRVGAQVGWELRHVGVDLTLAPDVDVNADPRNPVIGVRSFGTDPDLVGAHGAAWTRGVQSTGVAACAKHFPGHGDTAQDSHLSRPTVTADATTVRRRDLAPFAAAIAAGTETVMSSHILVPALDPDEPATFSRRLLRDLLRGELDFEGVVVSDALDMVGASGGIGVPAAAIRALRGGCDLLCLGTATTDEQLADVATVVEAGVGDDRLAGADLAAAADRVARLGASIAGKRRQLPVPAGFDPGSVPGLVHEDVARAIAVDRSARTVLGADRPLAWIRLEAEPNIAVGESPWGPFALGIEPVATVAATDDHTVAVAAVPVGSTAVLVGRDNHRHAFARDTIAAVRGAHPTVVVDMGWPDHGAGTADVATYGASRLVASALLHTLGVPGW